MKTLNVKVRTYTDKIVAKPANGVLMSLLHEYRSATNWDETVELDLFKSEKERPGYMSRFATLKKNDMSIMDWNKLMKLDTYKPEEKELACDILAKYADKFDSEYGVINEYISGN